jgi:hypothetical protein
MSRLRRILIIRKHGPTKGLSYMLNTDQNNMFNKQSFGEITSFELGS